MLMWRLSASLMNNGATLPATLALVRVQHQNRRCTGLHFWSPNRSNVPGATGTATPFNIGMLTSDDWGSYGRVVPKNKHLTGKIFPQRIERNNLTLRTRIKRLARKTTSFSRSVEIHKKVIGAFIEKHMLY